MCSKTCALFSVTECQEVCLDYIIQNIGMLEIRWGSLRRKVFLLSLTPTHSHTAGAWQEMFHTVHGTYLAMEWPTCTCSFKLAIGFYVFTYPTCACTLELELCPLVQPVFTTFLWYTGRWMSASSLCKLLFLCVVAAENTCTQQAIKTALDQGINALLRHYRINTALD